MNKMLVIKQTAIQILKVWRH